MTLERELGKLLEVESILESAPKKHLFAKFKRKLDLMQQWTEFSMRQVLCQTLFAR